MAIDSQKKTGTPAGYKDDRGGGVLSNHAEIAVVKDNIDPTHSGRIRVYVGRFGAEDPDNSKNWKTVSYLSPWFGLAMPGGSPYNGPENDGPGKFPGTPHSYGFWASAPDIGTKVICIFVEGNTTDGFYIGCVPEPGLTHMVPAIASSNYVKLNSIEAKTYGGADRLPVAEVNYTNPEIRNSENIYNKPKPVHSYQASILLKQGLIRDNIRGVIGSSSQRETPSRVFGISTPGYPIFSGGYDQKNIYEAAQAATVDKLQIVGRTGGHSIVMDDGTLDGQDQLMRFRTGNGHMIMLSDSGQAITIMHSNGQSWIELGKEGTVDVYSSNSVNIRTQGDLNLHADRDININAKENLNLAAKNIQIEASNALKNYAGTTFSTYATGAYTVNATGGMSLSSTGPAGFASNTGTWINGGVVFLNTGKCPIPALQVNKLTRTNHKDTTWNDSKGWINSAPQNLESVVSRAPTHMPWADLGKGVNVSTGSSQPAGGLTPSAAVVAGNAAAGVNPAASTDVARTVTVPDTSNASANQYQYPDAIGAAMIAQNAATVAAMPAGQKQAAGVVPGAAGVTLQQASGPGLTVKQGAGVFLTSLSTQAPGLPFQKIVSNTVLTGNNGITTVADLVNNTAAQVGVIKTQIDNASTALGRSGLLGGAGPVASAGAIFAAATTAGGIEKVQYALNTVGGISGQVNNLSVSLGNAWAGGLYAASMADKLLLGQKGLATSLAGLESNISLVGQKIGGIFGLQGTSRTAYSAVVASYGDLPSDKPVKLGGQLEEAPQDAVTAAINDYQRALDALNAAQKEVISAELIYRDEPTSQNLAAIRTAQAKESAAKQKLEVLKPTAVAAATSVSAQGARTAINSALSGSSAIPTTKNSGLAAIPGGIAAFAGVVSSKVTSTVDGVKKLFDIKLPSASGTNLPGQAVGTINTFTAGINNTVSNLGKNFSQAAGQFTTAVGNIMGNVKTAITGTIDKIAGPINAQINAIGTQVSAALSSAPKLVQDVAGKFIGGVAGGVAGIFGGVTSLLGGLGKAKVRERIVASDTFKPAQSLKAKTTQLVSDPQNPLGKIVPTPPTDIIEYKEQALVIAAASRSIYSLTQGNNGGTSTNLSGADQTLRTVASATDQYTQLQNTLDLKVNQTRVLNAEYNLTKQPETLQKLNQVNSEIGVLNNSLSAVKNQIDSSAS